MHLIIWLGDIDVHIVLEHNTSPPTHKHTLPFQFFGGGQKNNIFFQISIKSYRGLNVIINHVKWNF